jgi:hypothetical protein
MQDGDHAGLAMFEQAASGVEVVQAGDVRSLRFFHTHDEVAGAAPLAAGVVLLRVQVEGDTATFSYSLDDGRTFQQIAAPVGIRFSWWKGSRPSLFAYTTAHTADPGDADFDWVRYRPLEPTLP